MKNDTYAFVAGYVNDDSEKASEPMQWLQDKGVHFWDEIIDTEEAIVDGIIGCSLFVVLASPNSAYLPLTRDAIICAMSNRRPFLVIHLEKTQLPEGIELAFAGQATVRMYEEGWEKEIDDFLAVLWNPLLS